MGEFLLKKHTIPCSQIYSLYANGKFRSFVGTRLINMYITIVALFYFEVLNFLASFLNKIFRLLCHWMKKKKIATVYN